MKRGTKICLAVLGIGALAVVGLGYWGFSVFRDQAREAMNRDPVIQEHVGLIERIDLEWSASAEAAGDDVFVFEIEGRKGRGVVTAEFITVSAYEESIRSGTLRLPSGETFPIGENVPRALSLQEPSASEERAGPPPVSNPVVTVRVGGFSQQEILHFVEVQAAEVLVAGIWTVAFTVDDRDLHWLQDLVQRYGEAELVWNGRAVWRFRAPAHAGGYFVDRGFNDEATARRLADEIRQVHGPIAAQQPNSPR